jgi:hypothetical protein
LRPHFPLFRYRTRPVAIASVRNPILFPPRVQFYLPRAFESSRIGRVRLGPRQFGGSPSNIGCLRTATSQLKLVLRPGWNFSAPIPRLYFNDAVAPDGPMRLAPRGQFRRAGHFIHKPVSRLPLDASLERLAGIGFRTCQPKIHRQLWHIAIPRLFTFPSLASHRPAGTPTLAGFFLFLSDCSANHSA